MGSEYGTKEVDFMNQNSFNRFHDSAENIRNKVLNALPVILWILHPKTSSEGTEQKSMALLGCVL